MLSVSCKMTGIFYMEDYNTLKVVVTWLIWNPAFLQGILISFFSFFFFVSEDNELVRIILVKSGSLCSKLLEFTVNNEYSADPWTFNEMEKKLTLERFQKEVHLIIFVTDLL